MELPKDHNVCISFNEANHLLEGFLDYFHLAINLYTAQLKPPFDGTMLKTNVSQVMGEIQRL
jgi:hypothetical protein